MTSNPINMIRPPSRPYYKRISWWVLLLVICPASWHIGGALGFLSLPLVAAMVLVLSLAEMAFASWCEA